MENKGNEEYEDKSYRQILESYHDSLLEFADALDKDNINLAEYEASLEAVRAEVDSRSKELEKIDPRVEKAKSYNQIVISLGYGGFFAVWGFMRNLIDPQVQMDAALLMTLSVSFFVLNEVWNMFANSIDILRSSWPNRLSWLPEFVFHRTTNTGIWSVLYLGALGFGIVAVALFAIEFFRNSSYFLAL